MVERGQPTTRHTLFCSISWCRGRFFPFLGLFFFSRSLELSDSSFHHFLCPACAAITAMVASTEIHTAARSQSEGNNKEEKGENLSHWGQTLCHCALPLFRHSDGASWNRQTASRDKSATEFFQLALVTLQNYATFCFSFLLGVVQSCWQMKKPYSC